jgi:hypothetical protein
MSDFGTATYENRSFAAHRAKNCKSRLQNNQFWNRLNYIFNSNVVDDNEVNELVTFEKDMKKGMEDIKKGRYKIIG